jgi:dTMP kinase
VIPNPYPGTFIAFDGIDGCGKTEQIERTFKWLLTTRIGNKLYPYNVTRTEEPRLDSFWGRRIRQELSKPNGLHKTDPLGFQTWFACDSEEHLRRTVVPNLKISGSVVLSDRYRSSMVYGDRFIGDLEKLMEMNRAILGKYFIWPDVILIFWVSIDTALERLKKKGREFDEHEKRELLEMVSIRYRTFAQTYPNCRIVNAEGPPEEVFKEVKKIVLTVIESKPGPAV